MTDADFDYELRRLFLVFGGGIAFFVLLFAGRFLKVFFVGSRHRGVVAFVRTSSSRGQVHYSYDVQYEDPVHGRLIARERQEMPLQEFKPGDSVTIFVKRGEPPICEILSWRRLLFSLFIILLVCLGMFIAYQHFLGGKNA